MQYTLDSSRTLITCDKCDSHYLTFTVGARVDLQVFGIMWTLYMCKSHQRCDCHEHLFIQYAHARPSVTAFWETKHRAKIEPAYTGASVTHCKLRFSVQTVCTLHVLLASPTVCCCPGMKEIEQLYKAGHVALTVDHRNDDYVTAFHLDSRL